MLFKGFWSLLRSPVTLTPSCFLKLDGMRPDGASLVPCKGSKVLVWDVTCSDTLAPSLQVSLSVREPGDVAAVAEYKKVVKYGHLCSSLYCFILISVETLGVLGETGMPFSQGGCTEHWKGIGVPLSNAVSHPMDPCCYLERQCWVYFRKFRLTNVVVFALVAAIEIISTVFHRIEARGSISVRQIIAPASKQGQPQIGASLF